MVREFEYDEVDDDNQKNIHILDDDYDDDYGNVLEWDLSHDDIKTDSESDVEQYKQYGQVDAMQLLQRQIMFETKRNELLNIRLANDNLENECEKSQTKNVVENAVENELSDYVNYTLTDLNKLRQVDPLTQKVEEQMTNYGLFANRTQPTCTSTLPSALQLGSTLQGGQNIT